MTPEEAEQELFEAAKTLGVEIAQLKHRQRILRIALEAIYTQPYLTLAEARALAGRALEDTE